MQKVDSVSTTDSSPQQGHSSDNAEEKFSAWEEEVRRHHEIWRNKPVLRRIYKRWFEEMKAYAVKGRTLEIGGGFGSLKEAWPEIWASDVVSSRWLDLRADCIALPFAERSFSNLVAVDVLHHLYDPEKALGEIARVLKVGGRGIFIEPYVSSFSKIVRGMFHEEEQDLTKDIIYGADKKPEEANLAIPTRLFKINRDDFQDRFPGLKIHAVKFSDCLAYPLTGGFGRGSLLPQPILSVIEKMEPVFAPFRTLLGFKMLIVIEAVETP